MSTSSELESEVFSEKNQPPYPKVHKSIAVAQFLRTKGVSDISKLLAYHVLVVNTSRIGCFVLNITELSYYLDRPKLQIIRALKSLEKLTGFVQFDEVHHWILIPKFLKWNMPRTPNAQTAMLANVAQIPRELEIYTQLLVAISEYRTLFPPRVVTAIAELVEENNKAIKAEAATT